MTYRNWSVRFDSCFPNSPN